MSVIRPFKALRPDQKYVSRVAELPYDVMSAEEAREMTKDNPISFLHIDKAEIDFPDGIDIYSDQVYLKAKENYEKFVADRIYIEEEKPCIYIYEQTMNGRVQTGIAACASIDDYINNVIKKHELTRADKEKDRIRHVGTLDANTGPIFLAYRKNAEVNDILFSWKNSHEKTYSFEHDGILQQIWVIDDDAVINRISEIFEKDIPSLYIADGHHRAASAARVGVMKREQNPGFDGTEEFNFFLAVFFCDEDLAIMDYNRVIEGFNGMTKDEMLSKISENFTVKKIGANQYKPEETHCFGMYTENEWYKLEAKDGTFDKSDPVKSLDVSILQDNLIAPVLGIDDPRTSDRIDFVGGIRGLGELEKRANSDMDIAFAMFPTSMEELMNIADAGEIMPPKSTWFEPKLLSGIFIHKLS